MSVTCNTPTVDFEAALRRFGGRQHSLHRTAKAFVQTYESMPAQLQVHITACATHTLAEIAHRIRGSAGVLEAAQLAQLASGLEDAVRDGEYEHAHELAPKLAVALEAALAEISRYVEDNQPAPVVEVLPSPAELAAQLAPLIRDADFSAGPLLDQLAARLAGTRHAPQVDAIRALFDALDTDDAAELTQHLQASLAATQ